MSREYLSLEICKDYDDTKHSREYDKDSSNFLFLEVIKDIKRTIKTSSFLD